MANQKVFQADFVDGTSLSNGVDFIFSNNSSPVYMFFIMPSVWNGTAITFQATDEKGGTYKNVYDSGGTEISVTVANNRVIVPTAAIQAALASITHIKIRSGSSATPVNQQDDRSIKIVVSA
jgi:hypothetical protein